MTTCSRCTGGGLASDGEKPCPRCNGTGTEIAPLRIASLKWAAERLLEIHYEATKYNWDSSIADWDTAFSGALLDLHKAVQAVREDPSLRWVKIT